MTLQNRFNIELRWPIAPRIGAKDVADIKIVVDGNILTQLFDVEERTIRDVVRASATSLAIWVADNWWRLRWESIPDYSAVTVDWRLRHELTSVSGGTIWPPLMIYGVGDRVVMAPIPGGVSVHGPAVFRPMLVSVVAATSYEDGLDRFFQQVIAKCAKANDGNVLQALVNQLSLERKDPDIAAWRRLEARLGYDPDAAPEEVVNALMAQETLVGNDAMEEAATASPGESAPHFLKRAIEASEESRVEINLGSALASLLPSTASDLSRPTWMIAEDAASRLRYSAGWPTGPLLNKALSEIMAVRWGDVQEAAPTARGLPYAARLKTFGSTEKLALQTVNARDRRFELARAIGDTVWTRQSRFGVISRAKTDRQKFQRAFAQSLLIPFEDLREYMDLNNPSDDQIEGAAKRYHVNRNVVKTLLVNKGILPRETLAERLEAA